MRDLDDENLLSYIVCVCVCCGSASVLNNFHPQNTFLRLILSFLSAISANHHLRIFHLQLFSHMKKIEIIWSRGISRSFVLGKWDSSLKIYENIFPSSIKQFCVIFHIPSVWRVFLFDSNPKKLGARKTLCPPSLTRKIFLRHWNGWVSWLLSLGGCVFERFGMRMGRQRCGVKYIKEGKSNGSLSRF